MTTEQLTNDGVDWDDFCAWLQFKLHGKKTANSAARGRIILLFDTNAPTRRLVINLERRVELLFDRSGDPKLPKLLIRGAFDDWLHYLRAPTNDRAERLAMFGDWRLMKTLADLLVQKKSPLDVRVGR